MQKVEALKLYFKVITLVIEVMIVLILVTTVIPNLFSGCTEELILSIVLLATVCFWVFYRSVTFYRRFKR